MQAAHHVVIRLGRRDQLPDLFIGQAARIGDLGQVVAVLLQDSYVLFRRNPHHDQFAPFVGFADRLHLDPRCGRGQRAVEPQHVGIVGQLLRRADVVAEHVLRRRDALDERQMIDQRAAVLRVPGPLLVEFGKFFILGLLRSRGSR